MSQAMDVQSASLEKLNNLTLMQSLLQNMETNIYLIEQGSTGQIIQVSNANLFQLAAQYYGDATKWTAIAQANGLSDPVVQATITLTLNNNTRLVVAGFVAPQQSITVTLTTANPLTNAAMTTTYNYSILLTDTLATIALALATLIPGAQAVDNIVLLPTFSAIDFKVLRFLNLVIPQTAPDQGGILQT